MEIIADIKIKTDGMIAHVYVDGKEVAGVTGYHLFHEVENIPRLCVDLLVDKLDIDGKDAYLLETQSPAKERRKESENIRETLNNKRCKNGDNGNYYFSYILCTSIGTFIGFILSRLLFQLFS